MIHLPPLARIDTLGAHLARFSVRVAVARRLDFGRRASLARLELVLADFGHCIAC
jgi:hypothetical protein